MNISEKLTQIANKETENIELNSQLEQILYGKDMGGVSPWGDKSKIIKKSASGEYVALDDVSEIPHDIKVKLTSGGKNLWKHGDKTFTGVLYSNPVNLLTGITYTFSAEVTTTDTDGNGCLVYDGTNNKALGYIGLNGAKSITFMPTLDCKTIWLYAGSNNNNSQGDTATFKDIMLNEGSEALPYEPYKETLTDYSGVSLTRKGGNLIKFPYLQHSSLIKDRYGKTYTIGEDGGITISGTSTALDEFTIFDGYLPAGTYTLSCNDMSSGCALFVQMRDKNGVFYKNATNLTSSASGTFTITQEEIEQSYCRINIRTTSGTTLNNITLYPMLNFGNVALPYEKYQGQTLTANADGTVEGVKSTSPYMYMATDNPNVTINATYHKSYGMQTEYDRFWDSLQQKGARTNYNRAFFGWTEECFNPKYPIIINNNATALQETLAYGTIETTKVPIIAPFSTTMTRTFAGNHKLHTIHTLEVNSSVSYNGTFEGCDALINLVILGTIGQNGFNVSPCILLSKTSIKNIIDCLSATTSGLTVTLSATAVTNAFGSTTATEWTNLVATKTNWTISLV